MKTKYICTAAILMAAAASFSGCSTAPETAAENSAAVTVAPAALKAQAVTDKYNELRKQYQIRSNRWDYTKIAADFRAFYAENKDKMAQDGINRYCETLFRIGSYLEDPAVIDESVALIKAKAKDPARLLAGLIRSSIDTDHNATELKNAERLYEMEKNQNFLSIQQLFALYYRLTERTLHFRGDMKKAEYYINEVLTRKASFDHIKNPSELKKQMENVERDRHNTLKSVISAIIAFDLKNGVKQYEKYKSRFNEQEVLDFCLTFCRAAVDMKDRAFFDKMIAPIWASPDSNAKFERLRSAAARAGGNVGAQIYKKILENKNLSPNQRFHTLLATMSFPKDYIYFFYPEEGYQKAKAIYLEAMKIADANGIKGRHVEDATGKALNAAFEFGDYKFMDELLARVAGYDKSGIAFWGLRVADLIRQDKTKEAVALLDAVLNYPRSNAQAKKEARLWKYFINGGTFEGFDAEFADLKFNSVQKMEEIRKVGSMFFRAKKFEKARALNKDVVDNMFRPAETNKRYTVKYLKNAPKTAEAWARSKDYHKWDQMETRFTQYYGYDVHHDAKLLKDAVLTPLKDEYRAGLHIVFDDLGVHIYGRFNDPKVEEVNLGQRKGASLEWLFRPGKDNAYYSFYFDALPNTEDPHYVNWAAPTKNYRLTYETIFKDAVTTPEGYASHAFIPWIAVYDKLPSKDNQWILGLQVKNGDFRTLSGLVHEAGRALKLDFNFTPEQRTALEKTICIQAFNRYNAIRKNAGGIIQNWNDYLLGDPEFYEAVLKDYIAELDEAGKKLQEAKTAEEIHAMFVKYAPQWAEINYILEEKRSAYLKDNLFK